MITVEDMDTMGYKDIKETSKMTFDQYQEQAVKTAIYPSNAHITYPAMGLANEAGEVLGKVKKFIRDGRLDREGAIAEIGDVLWYAAALARDLNTDLSVIAQQNLNKLADRAKRGVLGGSGDKR
jgi:NTP pyrophosphatase (non-canonical NTP hydrolase)